MTPMQASGAQVQGAGSDIVYTSAAAPLCLGLQGTAENLCVGCRALTIAVVQQLGGCGLPVRHDALLQPRGQRSAGAAEGCAHQGVPA